MGQVCHSRGHVCCRLFAHFGLAKDYGHAETQPQPQQAAAVSHEVSADLPNAQTASAASDMPQANIATQQPATEAKASVNQQLISVQTDLYHLWINPKGGDIVRIELLNHDKSKDSNEAFVMLESDAKRTYVAQSGLIGLNGPDSNRSGRPMYEIEKSAYTLNDAKAVQTEDGKSIKVLTVPMVLKQLMVWKSLKPLPLSKVNILLL